MLMAKRTPVGDDKGGNILEQRFLSKNTPNDGKSFDTIMNVGAPTAGNGGSSEEGSINDGSKQGEGIDKIRGSHRQEKGSSQDRKSVV